MRNIFGVHADVNDVETLMGEVAAALRRWEGGEAMALDLALPGGGEGDLLTDALRLPLRSQVDSDAIIHSTRPALGPWIIRFQRIVRRSTWWFIEPILQQIRGFQADMAHIVVRVVQNQEALRHDLAKARVEERLEALEAEVRALRSRLDSLEGRHES